MKGNGCSRREFLKVVGAGYATGCFGKWHNGRHYPYHPNGQGFDEFLGFCAGHWNNYFDTEVDHNGRMVRSKGYINDVFTDAAIDFIKDNRITDNGPNTYRFNGNMKGRKGSVHEGGGRVPCFVKWPGHIQAATTVKKITAHIDMLPTLLELAGVEATGTKPLDGVSLVPLLEGRADDWPDRMLFTLWRGRGGVRTEQYRLTVERSRVSLYDMAADPGQLKDIAGDRPGVTKRLKEAYEAWLKDVSRDGFDPIAIPIGYAESPLVVMPGHEAFLSPEDRRGISYVGRTRLVVRAVSKPGKTVMDLKEVHVRKID